MGHSKLGPHSTSSPAGEEQFSCILLSRDDDAAGGVSKRRRLETVVAPKARQAWPCLGTASSMGREKTQPARSAPQARDPSLVKSRSFQNPSREDVWKQLHLHVVYF